MRIVSKESWTVACYKCNFFIRTSSYETYNEQWDLHQRLAEHACFGIEDKDVLLNQEQYGSDCNESPVWK